MAKGNYVAAARNYEQAQQRFFFGMDRVALYQARNTTRPTTWRKPRLRSKGRFTSRPGTTGFASTSRTCTRSTRTGPQPHPQGSREGKQQGEGEGRLAQVLNAIEDFKLALQLFQQIQAVLQADKQKEGKKSLAGDWH